MTSIHRAWVHADSTKQTSTRFSWTSADRSFGETTVEHQKLDMKSILVEEKDRLSISGDDRRALHRASSYNKPSSSRAFGLDLRLLRNREKYCSVQEHSL